MTRRITVTLLLSAAIAFGFGPATADESALADERLERFSELLETRERLRRETHVMEFETRLARRSTPYILVDLERRALEFRIRGKVFKTYAFEGFSLDPHTLETGDPESIWKRLDAAMTVIDIEGGQPELIPPDLESGRENGLLYADPNQLREQTGAIPISSDAGLLGVDAPTEYYIRFDPAVRFHIRTAVPEGLVERAVGRLGEMAQRLRRALFGGDDAPSTDGEIPAYITLDPETAKLLHHSLLPGERVLIVPPAPAPVRLISMEEDGRASEGNTISASR